LAGCGTHLPPGGGKGVESTEWKVLLDLGELGILVFHNVPQKIGKKKRKAIRGKEESSQGTLNERLNLEAKVMVTRLALLCLQTKRKGKKKTIETP